MTLLSCFATLVVIMGLMSAAPMTANEEKGVERLKRRSRCKWGLSVGNTTRIGCSTYRCSEDGSFRVVKGACSKGEICWQHDEEVELDCMIYRCVVKYEKNGNINATLKFLRAECPKAGKCWAHNQVFDVGCKTYKCVVRYLQGTQLYTNLHDLGKAKSCK